MNGKLPYKPEDFVTTYVAAMNAGDVDLCCMHYEETASLVDAGGNVVTGLDAIRKIIVEFLAGEPIIECTTGLLVVNGDMGLHRSNWTGSFLDAKGERYQASGAGTEIIHRGADGVWRHAIDIPDPAGLGYP